MKGFESLTWEKFRDWLAEAGMAQSGCHVDSGEKSNPRPALLPRRWVDQAQRGSETLPAHDHLSAEEE